MDNYRLCASVTEHDAKKAGAEVVKQVASPCCPACSTLDCRRWTSIPRRRYAVWRRRQRKDLHLRRNSICPSGLQEARAFDERHGARVEGEQDEQFGQSSKIDFLDTPKEVQKKIADAVCAPGEVEGNGVLGFVRAVLFQLPG